MPCWVVFFQRTKGSCFLFLFCFVLIVHLLPEIFIHTMFSFFFFKCSMLLQLGWQRTWFIVHTWHLAATEDRASPECCSPGQGTNRNCFSYEPGGALRGGLGDWRVMEVRYRLEGVISSHLESRSRASVPGLRGCAGYLSWASPQPSFTLWPYITSLQLTAWCRGFYRERGQDYSWSSMIISKEKKLNFINFVGRQS